MRKFITVKPSNSYFSSIIYVDKIEQIDVVNFDTIYISHNKTTTMVKMTIEELCTLISDAKGE